MNTEDTKKNLNLALFLSCARSAPLFLASRGVGPRRQLRRSWVPSLTLPPLLAFSRAGARPPVHGGVHPHEPHLILEVLVQQRRPVVPRALLRLPLSLAEAAARPPAAEPEDGDGDAEQRQREGHRQEEQRQTRRPPRRSAAPMRRPLVGGWVAVRKTSERGGRHRRGCSGIKRDGFLITSSANYFIANRLLCLLFIVAPPDIFLAPFTRRFPVILILIFFSFHATRFSQTYQDFFCNKEPSDCCVH
jgi:hypothetical protein